MLGIRMHFIYLFALALLHESKKEGVVRWSCAPLLALVLQRNTSAHCNFVQCAGSALVVHQRSTSEHCNFVQFAGSALVDHQRSTRVHCFYGVCVGVQVTWPEGYAWRELGVTTRGFGLRW